MTDRKKILMRHEGEYLKLAGSRLDDAYKSFDSLKKTSMMGKAPIAEKVLLDLLDAVSLLIRSKGEK